MRGLYRAKEETTSRAVPQNILPPGGCRAQHNPHLTRQRQHPANFHATTASPRVTRTHANISCSCQVVVLSVAMAPRPAHRSGRLALKLRPLHQRTEHPVQKCQWCAIQQGGSDRFDQHGGNMQGLLAPEQTLPGPALPGPALPGPALPGPALPGPALLGRALPGLAGPGALPQLVPVPDGAPPYDCEVHGTACQSPGSFWGDLPDDDCRTPTVPARAAAAGAVADAVGSSAGTMPAGEACASALWPRQFAQAITETLAGIRPLRQLTPWTTEQARDQVHALEPLLRTGSSPRIVRVLASLPDAAVAEITVVATFGARTRALAMRFEHVAARPAAPGLPGRPARWLCTDVEAG